jgi:catalase-peroxidase
MAWHSAGVRIPTAAAGGAGQQRFAPSTVGRQHEPRQGAPVALADQAKCGRKLSWADLIVFAGNCALESMGFKTFGFGGGRKDVWEPEDIDWGRGT